MIVAVDCWKSCTVAVVVVTDRLALIVAVVVGPQFAGQQRLVAAVGHNYCLDCSYLIWCSCGSFWSPLTMELKALQTLSCYFAQLLVAGHLLVWAPFLTLPMIGTRCTLRQASV